MDNFDYSVIIPTRNRATFLKEAINSILMQKNVSVEIIIVDDNSDDNTEDVVKEFGDKLKYHRNKDCKFAHISRKIGYQYAIGEYIIFMDDDDFYVDNTFFYNAKQIMDKNHNIAMVIGSTIIYESEKYKQTINLNGNGLVGQKEYMNNFPHKYSKPSSTLTCIFRKNALDKYDLNNSLMVNDTCLYLRGMLAGDIYLINKAVAAYRIHSSNISKKRFSNEFMDQCLFEKKKIYIYAKRKNLLINPEKWFNSQISTSAYYFISASSYNLSVIYRILRWIFLFGNGIRIYFIIGLLTHKK